MPPRSFPAPFRKPLQLRSSRRNFENVLNYPPMIFPLLRSLKLPAVPPWRDREYPILKVVMIYSHRPFIPQQTAGNTLAPGYTGS